MKASDFLVEYLISKGVTDVFGYPGGMITHFMDSINRKCEYIKIHLTYHEQGASFAACGYAQARGKMGVAYATSGPGATNLITGICNAYFDSIPVLFITGQVNTFESKDGLAVRQRGFQETDIVSMVKMVTKYAAKINCVDSLKYHLDCAFYTAFANRKGPVLLDIPMNIFQMEIEPDKLYGFTPAPKSGKGINSFNLNEEFFYNARKPLILLGNGIKTAGAVNEIRTLVLQLDIPVVTTMIAVDVPPDNSLYYGFIGAYGSRIANFIVSKCDLLISIGARLDIRQVGAKREKFAPNAKIVRIDIDEGELSYKVHDDEIQICADIKEIRGLFDETFFMKYDKEKYTSWIGVCNLIKDILSGIDDRLPNYFVREIGRHIPDNAVITTDVGQNQVWVSQSIEPKAGQTMLFSGGHGAMGYSLPAAIGAYIAVKRPVFCFNGDGGIQMNMQELMAIVREKLPIKIILLNNYALGMIRHFQEMYFNKNYVQTTNDSGYTVPDFEAICEAYGIRYRCAERIEDIKNIDTKIWNDDLSSFVEIRIKEDTFVYPKLEFGKPNQDQEPLLERELYNRLDCMDIETIEDRMMKNMLKGGVKRFSIICVYAPRMACCGVGI